MTSDEARQDLRGEVCDFGPDGLSPLHPLAQLSVLVHAQVAAVAERHGLTPMQARLLGLLVRRPRRMAELAQGLGVEKAALTGLVDRAESRALVTREAVPGDRRSVRVVVTESGAAASNSFYAQLADALDGMTAALPADDCDTFGRCTQAIVGRATGTLEPEASTPAT